MVILANIRRLSSPSTHQPMNLKHYLDQRIETCLHDAGAADAPAVVKRAGKPEFGHYQANGVMGAAKKMSTRPADLAARVTEALATSDFAEVAELEVAGPGFINITLKPGFIAKRLRDVMNDERLGVSVADNRRKVLVDYSSPNLAKEMHIGHLRSTAIGDAAVRILEFLGHDVIRANHVGDWGAQFGSLLAYMDMVSREGGQLATALKDLEVFYRQASELFQSDETFANKAREFVVRLQNGDEQCLRLWREFIAESTAHCQAIYDLLDISLSPADMRAESAYNDDLAGVIEELEAQGLIVISDGARCIFLPGFTGKDGKPLPAIVQKSDGGYPYMATDLAAARYRGRQLKVDRALYFVDGRQSLHLKQLYTIAEMAGFIGDGQEFIHIPFGAILNKEGKPFKTRAGGAVKLADVAEEAVARAMQLVRDKNPDIKESDREAIARILGIGAIKYAELSRNRTTDYIFDWDTMLSFEGNTAPYLLYAYTRIMSIFRRTDINRESLEAKFTLTQPTEINLAIRLLQYHEAIEGVLEDFQANMLCNYLYELAGDFMSFYESCPVLKAEKDIQQSRLSLCHLSARTLQHGLGLLGIGTVEQM